MPARRRQASRFEGLGAERVNTSAVVVLGEAEHAPHGSEGVFGEVAQMRTLRTRSRDILFAPDIGKRSRLRMSSTKTASARSRELIQLLAQAINSAQSGYEVWYTLAGKDKGYSLYSAELQDYQYRDFFDSAINAHYKVVFIDISRLFDTDKREPSFHKLKKSLNRDGFDDIVDRIGCTISAHKDLIMKIKGNRNKRVAHYDTTWTEERVLEEYGIIPNEIRSLLEAFNELLVETYKDVVSPNTAYPFARLGRFEQATFQLLHTLKSAPGDQGR